jgi:hypothetical protein
MGASRAGAVITLMQMVLTSCLRLLTSPKVLPQATSINAAVALVDALVASPVCNSPCLARRGRSCVSSASTSH